MTWTNTDLKWIGRVRVVCTEITTCEEWNNDTINAGQCSKVDVWSQHTHITTVLARTRAHTIQAPAAVANSTTTNKLHLTMHLTIGLTVYFWTILGNRLTDYQTIGLSI